MKKTSLTALALTGALALGAVPAHAQDNDMAHRVEEVTNAAIKAFEAHGEKTYTANAWFSVDGIGEGMDVEWAIPISTSQELIDFIAPSDERFRAALDNLKPVEHYTNPVGAPTPARAANGQIVVVLPHSGAVTVNGGIVIEDLQSGGMVQMTEDEKSSVPVVSPSADVKLLFGSGDKTSTYDPSGAATQSVGNNGHMAQYTRDNGETGTVIENERGEEQDVDINLAGNIDNLPVLNPGDRVRLTIDANVTNTTGQDLTYSVQPYGTTEDVDVDKRDGTEDGLYPITDEDNRPVEGRTTVSGNDTQVTVEFVVPDDGLVYLNHRLLDEDGNDVAPQKMDTIMVAEPEMDVQASTESGNSQLVDGKQTIYNQASITNLTPGKSYQVLVNLFQCDAPGDCSEIAAVNREIIPRNNNSIQNFSVLVDANSLGSSDSTLEWETRLYEGTGDIYNMGDLIHEVADRGENQVVSPSGSRTSLDTKRTQKSGTVTINAQEGDVNEVEVNDNGLDVGDEEPPASIDEVRSNNEELTKQNESPLAGQWIGTAVVTALVLLVVAGFAIAAFFRGKLRRANKRKNGKGDTAVVTDNTVDNIDGKEIIDDNDNSGGSNGRGR